MFKVIAQRQPQDCGIACLAMFLTVSYEDANEAVLLANHSSAKKGLYLTSLVRAAARLGVTLKARRPSHPAYKLLDGILVIKHPKWEHFVVVYQNRIIDPDMGTVWKWQDYFLAHPECSSQTLLTR